MSWKASSQQEKLSNYELEMLTIVEALKKFRGYLLGTTTKIVTDCNAFQKTKSKSLEPYNVDKTNPNDHYEVAKVRSNEGPAATSTSADYKKPWTEDITA
ncbi:hypothetical protein TNCT_409451 [Trichonephila clavata]|uniref:Reverse transcriptase RNase H-like domain-containing protein n=1 Tax=Trichonephila clavata TaxID=2740835 RepID=A0A8X6F2J2_TRICU|nr:hypothetical protein TNCT_409451 [Trichonephila clavata]